jgi:hypothetical protein
MHVVSAGLGNAGGSDILVALVDSVLHLLEELIDVDQIVLGADVGHRRKVVTRSLGAAGAVTATADRNRCRHLLIFRYRAIENGKLQSLQAEETLADRGI